MPEELAVGTQAGPDQHAASTAVHSAGISTACGQDSSSACPCLGTQAGQHSMLSAQQQRAPLPLTTWQKTVAPPQIWTVLTRGSASVGRLQKLQKAQKNACQETHQFAWG